MKLRSGKIINTSNDITVTITNFTMTGHGFFGITDDGEKAYIPNSNIPYGHKIKKLGESYKAYFVSNGIYSLVSSKNNKR